MTIDTQSSIILQKKSTHTHISIYIQYALFYLSKKKNFFFSALYQKEMQQHDHTQTTHAYTFFVVWAFCVWAFFILLYAEPVSVQNSSCSKEKSSARQQQA